MPRIPGLLERIQQPLYDTITITPGETQFRLFEDPLANSVSSKTTTISEKDLTISGLTCPLCRDELLQGITTVTTALRRSMFQCQSCSTIYHRGCAREMGGCSTIGCSQKGKTIPEITPMSTKFKTMAHTNMTLSQCLPFPKNFEVHAIGLHYDRAINPYELDTFKSESWMNFFVGTKSYLELPLDVFEDIAAAKNFNSYVFAEPIDLIPMQNFYIDLIYEGEKPLDTAFKLKCSLQGFFKREVH